MERKRYQEEMSQLRLELDMRAADNQLLQKELAEKACCYR